MIQQTSIMAYSENKREIESQRERVLVFFKNHPNSTDREASEYLKLEAGRISARRAELMKVGKVLPAGIRRCNITGVASMTWVVV